MNDRPRLRFILWISGAFVVWLLAILLAPMVGAEQVDMGSAFATLTGNSQGGVAFDIVFLQRLPRALLGAIVGGALGITGASFQAILRNPLATPYTLGVASAGSLGALIVISFGLSVAVGPFTSVQLGALLGAGLDVILVSALARRVRGAGHLLLAGITVSLVGTALMMLVRYISSPYRLAEMDRWMMGGIDIVGYDPVAAMLPILIPGLAIILFHTRAIDQLALGYRMASARGVDVAVVQRDVFLGGSLVTAAVVSAAGPIGFVGLIIPHAIRRIAPRDHRIIMPVSFAAAGAFLVLADAFARVVVAPAELPVGVLTAAIGGPLFLWILSRSGTKRARN
jgi:ABC-type Fe3+-siderophore transport system permease subunit